VEEPGGLERDELHLALYEELGRLPEKYRAPLVLCYIEGPTHEAVARQLRWPLGTVRVRIARGRDLLGTRLTRRGLTPAAVLLALSLLPTAAADVAPRLVEHTVRAAAGVAVGERVPRGEAPARVVDLERKARKAMQLTRLRWATAFALEVIVTGAGVAAVPRALAVADDISRARAEQKKLQGTWVIVSAETGGEKREGDGSEEQLKIEGDAFSIEHGGHVEERGTIRLDPSKEPSEIDLQFQEGKHEGKTDLAIYAWDGANLKLCWVREGEKRPTDFTTKPGDHRVLMVLKRQGP
jgi:uncharacterized protein (TIGR03067 family)